MCATSIQESEVNFVKTNVRPKKNHFHSWYVLSNPKNPSDILDTDIIVHYIELSKVKKQEGKLADWVRLFQTVTGNETEEEINNLVKKSSAMKEAYRQYKNCTKEEALMLYALSKEKHLLATIGREQYNKMLGEKAKKDIEQAKKDSAQATELSEEQIKELYSGANA